MDPRSFPRRMLPQSQIRKVSLAMSSIHQFLSSTSLHESNYVLALASLPNYYVASASSPSNKITLFDKAGLRSVQILPGHEDATTYLRTIYALGGSTRSTLLSSGKDGCVRAWDERSGGVSIQSEPTCLLQQKHIVLRLKEMIGSQ